MKYDLGRFSTGSMRIMIQIADSASWAQKTPQNSLLLIRPLMKRRPHTCWTDVCRADEGLSGLVWYKLTAGDQNIYLLHTQNMRA